MNTDHPFVRSLAVFCRAAPPPRPSHSSRCFPWLGCLLASCLSVLGCGGDGLVQVDQVVHEGPVAEPRPPRPVALERATGEMVRFSTRNGEVSARVAPPEGRVLDAAARGERLWWIVERPGERRVTAVGPDGKIVWSRPVPGAERAVPATAGSVVVFADAAWWWLGADGGVRWRLPGREVAAAGSTGSGAWVVTPAPEPSGAATLWHLDQGGAELVSQMGSLDQRYVALPDGRLVGLSLEDGDLWISFDDDLGDFRSLQVPWPYADRLVAARSIGGAAEGTIALISQDPPALGLLALDGPPRLTWVEMPSVPTEAASDRSLWAAAGRLIVATRAGLVAYDLGAGAPVDLALDERFGGAHLTMPLTGP